MKPIAIVIIVVLFVAGVVGGYLFIQSEGQSHAGSTDPSPTIVVPDINPAVLHGISLEIPENAAFCAEHHIPEVICPFCDPSLIEELGYCGGHDVPEALCSRCNPTLIAAFKAEGDWCASHGLPESQCLICNPE